MAGGRLGNERLGHYGSHRRAQEIGSEGTKEKHAEQRERERDELETEGPSVSLDCGPKLGGRNSHPKTHMVEDQNF